LFNGRVSTAQSPIKIITRYGGPNRFSASVVRTQIPGHAVSFTMIVEARKCDSDTEALQTLYKASQSLLNKACQLSSQGETTGFDRWDDLVKGGLEGGWDYHCFVSTVAVV